MESVKVVNKATGEVIAEISPSKARRLAERQRRLGETIVIVCRWCWALDEHASGARAGTMRKDKETGLYEHDFRCAGKIKAGR